MKRMIAMVLLLITLSGCASLDLVLTAANQSFTAVLAVKPVQETDTEWVLSAPDDTASLHISKETTAAQQVSIVTDAAPFLAAGLDASKLVGSVVIDGQLMVGANFTSKATQSQTAEDIFGDYLRAGRRQVGYHAALGHMGLGLGDGNMFEWAKSLEDNDKDIVFVLNPEPLAAAGVDTAHIEGWLLATVDTMDERGKPIKVAKLLKPFNLQ